MKISNLLSNGEDVQGLRDIEICKCKARTHWWFVVCDKCLDGRSCCYWDEYSEGVWKPASKEDRESLVEEDSGLLQKREILSRRHLRVGSTS